jgi:hypothetical protein
LKKLDLGDMAQTVATVGVLGGLVLLAYELHQNNELLEAQAHLELSQNRITANDLLATDDGLGSAMVRGMNGEDLTPLETFKLRSFYVAAFTRWEWEHEQYRRGLIDEEQLPASDWSQLMRTWPGAKAFWNENREHGRTSDFVEFMEENVVNER